MTENPTETEAVRALYDNLTPYHGTDGVAWIVNNGDGLRYLSVAVASTGGDAGGVRLPSVVSHRLYPGLNRVQAGYAERVEADAKRQRERIKGGGVLSKMIDSGTIEIVRSLDRVKADKVAAWLEASADIGLVNELRSHDKHGPAAQRAFDAWHSRDSGDDVARLRHFWAMATGSRKVA